ncbi:MAG: phosphodiester glycosidase family protein [Lacibacter sp.]
MVKLNGNRKKLQWLYNMNLKKIITAVFLSGTAFFCSAQQLKWVNVDSMFAPLPSSVHVFKTTDSIEGKPNIAFYVVADIKDRHLTLTTDTTLKRRFTPQQFYNKNQQPLIVVNGTFFEFETNRNLNTVIKQGELVSYNVNSVPLKGKDTLKFQHTFRSAIGLSKKRKPDIAWLFTDTGMRYPLATQKPFKHFSDSARLTKQRMRTIEETNPVIDGSSYVSQTTKLFQPWEMQTAIGGGPVLVQDGKPFITNNQEAMFSGKAIDDRHPRTAMGYTADGKWIILAVQGRFNGIAEGASLKHLADILVSLGCVEALNLDGGGSSCLLVNGKETIQPSDKTGQRPVPGVFLIEIKKK